MPGALMPAVKEPFAVSHYRKAWHENDYFPTPIITPSTKAEAGHDEDISKEEIIAQGLATEADWKILEHYTLALFARGKEIAAKQGLILVDTKYEFGKIQRRRIPDG